MGGSLPSQFSPKWTFSGFLEGLCDYLYDYLRPRILHEPSLETLCGVCTVLQALMVQDVSDLAENDTTLSAESTPGFSPYMDGEDDYFASTPKKRTSVSRQYSGSMITRRDSLKKKTRKPLGRLHTEVLLRMVLQDAQTRLVFRGQALIRADVEYYTPKEGDLDYPQRIASGALSPHSCLLNSWNRAGSRGYKVIQNRVSVSLDTEDDEEPTSLSLPSPKEQESWYPTLRVTLWVLSCLYTYVAVSCLEEILSIAHVRLKAAVFEDLAQEAVVTCRKSLTSASDILAAKKEKSMDARLFLVRHLLILKEMTAGLELGGRDRRRDWQGITGNLANHSHLGTL